MQKNIDDILREWFYRLPNGYAIEPYNTKELEVLKQVLTEQGISADPIIETLNQLDQAFLDAKPVEEAPKKDDMFRGREIGTDFDFAKYNAKVEKMNDAKATENMHEIMYAVALAHYIQKESIPPPRPKDLDDYIAIIDKVTGKTLKQTTPTHRETVIQTVANLPEKYIEMDREGNLTQPSNPLFTNKTKSGPGFYGYWDDAVSAAENSYEFIREMYGNDPGFKFNNVWRVGKRGTAGSEVADDVVEISMTGAENQELYVSLKYGPAQFGSLSVTTLLKYLYGFDIDVKGLTNKGLLSYGYFTGLDTAGDEDLGDIGSAIDYSLRAYVQNINDFIDENPDKIKTASFDRKKKKGTEYIWKPEFRADPEKITYDKWREGGLETDQSYAYRYIYMQIMRKADRGPSLAAKTNVLNKAIDNLVKVGKYGQEKANEDFGELISYLLRTDQKNPDSGYIYVAKGGAKLVSIPSHNIILAKTKQLTIEWEEYKNDIADYLRNMKIIGDGKLLAIIPLKFRFADGQWTSDLAQKGPAPTFFHPEFEEFFNAKGDEIDVK